MMNETVLIGSVGLLWVLVLFNLVLTLGLVRRVNTNTGPQLIEEEEGLEAGEPAPDFTAETLDGQQINLASYAGRDVVFLFMSPFCGPCREKLPGIEALAPSAYAAGTELVYVSNASVDETRAYVEEHTIALPVVVASPGGSSFYEDYKISGTPQFCVVDAQGRVQASGYPAPEVDLAWRGLTERWAAVQPRTDQETGGRKEVSVSTVAE